MKSKTEDELREAIEKSLSELEGISARHNADAQTINKHFVEKIFNRHYTSIIETTSGLTEDNPLSDINQEIIVSILAKSHTEITLDVVELFYAIGVKGIDLSPKRMEEIRAELENL